MILGLFIFLFAATAALACCVVIALTLARLAFTILICAITSIIRLIRAA